VPDQGDRADSAAMFCGFDLRESPGVLPAVFIRRMERTHRSQTSRSYVPDSKELPPAKPRFATIKKDENSFVTGISESVTQLLAWTIEEMEGHRSLEFIHTEDHPLAIDNWMEMIVTSGPARRVRLRPRTGVEAGCGSM
jgi:hypothetical protein